MCDVVFEEPELELVEVGDTGFIAYCSSLVSFIA